ncbi:MULTISPECIES: mercury methylation ferredoxin HgcB [unclassified Pseudodesulfovibrio]|uniref:mercury methylation ferredoxin HgcB n=1 Tax=unclassified Pseudodesulfovibrio TaxID=2661612 RepID=UPI000FEBBE1B|nr:MULTISPECIES: mercury methylation ferredoxin HgcB [unclassified Pseudodesulfovibrio]MCJ2165891.1 4Fe-4S binding protein [Pseudodesulfovibrio sp. S3-i]RWU02675.1 4Fe-4S dicluster domain-containing protein [Pseudodesulfovibrio sp. S3]
MKEFRYIDDISTLKIDTGKCIGCGLCVTVCPHRVLTTQDKKADVVDFNACMECGACAQNCPTAAITVTPGVGCASYIISLWLHKLTEKKVSTGCC